MDRDKEQSFKMQLPEIREVRETLRVPVEGYGLCSAMSRGARYIALGGMVPSQYGLIHLFDSAGKLLWRHKTREAISSVAISRSGDYLAAASDDNNIYFFDRRGLLQWRHEASRLIKSMAVSENGDYLVAGSEDANIYYFDKNRQIKKFVWKFRFEGSVAGVAMSLSGRHIVAGSADRMTAYFDGAGQLLWSQEAQDVVSCVAMSADGGVVASGSMDHNLYIFNGTGGLLHAHDCGAPVIAVAVSARGDSVVAAAGQHVICVDLQGTRLWSIKLGANVIRMAASEMADAVLAATEDKALSFVTRPGAFAWRYQSQGGIYGIALSEDRELALACGPGAVDHFENSKIFRELVSRHQLALNGMKREGQDVSAQEASIRSGLTSLGTRNYTAVAETFKEIQDSLAAMDRISQEREKLRGDTADALAKVLDVTDKLKLEAGTAASEEPMMKQLHELVGRSDQSFRAGKYSEALGDIRKAEELAGTVRQARSGRIEIMMMVESITAQLQEARKLDVDTSAAESHLERARSLLKTGNLPSASDEAMEAAKALLAARSTSPRAIEAEFERASRIIDSPTATESDLRLAEDGIAGALPGLLKERDFEVVADIYEKLAACWARRPATPAAVDGLKKATVMAIAAHRDGGNLDKAVDLAKAGSDWNTAAKLLMAAGDKSRANDAWTRAATEKKPRLQVPEDVRLWVDGELAAGRVYEAACELARAGFVLEASRMLGRGEPDGRSAALLFRLMFHLQDIPGVLEAAKGCLPVLRDLAKESGDPADLSSYGHVLVGALELARLLEAPDSVRLQAELQEFAHDYSRALARDEVRASEICDLTVLYAYLLEGNWKAVERLAEIKGGPTWDHLKGALAAWNEVNLKLFREETTMFLRSRPGRIFYPTQTLPDVIPPENFHEALNAMAPFNHIIAVHNILDKISDKEYLGSIVKRADADIAAGREEQGAELYGSALAMDTFGLLDTRKIHLRIAGYLLYRKMESEAVPHLEAARAGRDAALAEYRSLRGQAVPGQRKPAAAARAPQPAAAGKNPCPRCGAPVPAKAIRCFKCGKSLK
jgi:outer membrane protein assembly factor BamB